MSVTLTSVERINALKNGIESITGETYADLTEGVQALKNGYNPNGNSEFVSIIQERLYDNSKGACSVFSGWQLPESYIALFDFSKVESFVTTFYANRVIKNLTIDTQSAKNIQQICSACVELETVVFSDTSKVVTWNTPFSVCRKLKSIKTLDFSNVTTVTNPFVGCDIVEELLFVPETIKVSIAIPSPFLNTESKQSIIDGLAYVTTTKTLTVDADAGFTEEQKATAKSKGWTVVEN